MPKPLTKVCAVPTCERPIHAHGWCVSHAARAARHGDPLGGGPSRRSWQQGLLCSEDGCDRPRAARSFCSLHYLHWRRVHNPLCSFPECDQATRARGWCPTHWLRWRKYGDPSIILVTPGPVDGVCSVEGCDRPHNAHGYCGMHQGRFNRHGDPLFVAPPHARVKVTRYIDQAGYVWIWAPTHPLATMRPAGQKHNGFVAEHRKKWWDLRGPFPNGYVVHHHDGDKGNNRIRNLRLMTRRQHARLHNSFTKQEGDPEPMAYGAYVKVRAPGHPTETKRHDRRGVLHGSGWALEHRKKWWDMRGPIPKGYLVHHRNGNRADNRIRNLQLMTWAEHSRMHNSRRYGLRQAA